jgi:hypothetical protein
MHYLIYKITNRIDNKFYVGKHKTKNKDDDYFGSGLLLERAVAKHGKENFTKEILFELPTEDAMNQKEADIVDEDFVMRDDTYNLKLGGQGGWDYILKNKLNQTDALFESCRRTCYLGGQKIRELWNDPMFRDAHINIAINNLPSWRGRKHTDETIEKMRRAKIGKYVGKNNPQYGTMWITDGVSNRKIKASDDIPTGFRRGRTV